MQVALAKSLQDRVAVEASTVQYLPAITFGRDNKPDEAGTKALALLRTLGPAGKELRFTIVAPQGRTAERRISVLRTYLPKEFAIPAARIATVRTGGREIRVRVTVP
jgi:hypothetical protein